MGFGRFSKNPYPSPPRQAENGRPPLGEGIGPLAKLFVCYSLQIDTYLEMRRTTYPLPLGRGYFSNGRLIHTEGIVRLSQQPIVHTSFSLELPGGQNRYRYI